MAAHDRPLLVGERAELRDDLVGDGRHPEIAELGGGGEILQLLGGHAHLGADAARKDLDGAVLDVVVQVVCRRRGRGRGRSRSVALRGDPEPLETSEHERARHPLVVALGDIGEAENAAPVDDEQASTPPYPADAALDEPERCEGVRGRVGHAQCERLRLERLRDGGLRRRHDHELGARAAEAASELAEHVEARAGLGLGLEQGQHNGCAGGKRAEIDGRAAGGGQAKRFERCIKLRHPSRPGHRRPEARRSAPAARRRSTRSDGRRR